MLLSSGQIKGERKLVRVFVAKLSSKIQTKRQKEGARKQNMLFALFDHDPVRNIFCEIIRSCLSETILIDP